MGPIGTDILFSLDVSELMRTEICAPHSHFRWTSTMSDAPLLRFRVLRVSHRVISGPWRLPGVEDRLDKHLVAIARHAHQHLGG